ncbi:hypothetical protein D3C83_56610 [compost metagenome]
MAQISASGAALDGMMVLGTPARIAAKTWASVAPAVHRRVRSWRATPFASAPWHSAHRSRNNAIPVWTAAGSPARRGPATGAWPAAAPAAARTKTPRMCPRKTV